MRVWSRRSLLSLGEEEFAKEGGGKESLAE